MHNEDRLVAIESKLTSQEDLVEILNRTLYRQQNKIDELESLCRSLAKRLADMPSRDVNDMPAHEKPPHY